MTAQARFARDPEVVGKVIDGEAIIINLATGMYYSADEVGGLIWTLIDNGHSIDEAAAHVSAHYEIETDRARADIERIARLMVDEGLIKQTELQTAPVSAAVNPLPQRRPYVAPSLEAHRDMKDLLALDPPMPALKRNPWERS
jgi:hypothetical protein